MLVCVVCGCAYLPWDRPRDETCKDCWRLNFKDSQELRVHDEGAPLTEGQRGALLRLATAHAREAEHQVYVQACLERDARRRLAQEDGHA
jgi:hypothetical protein